MDRPGGERELDEPTTPDGARVAEDPSDPVLFVARYETEGPFRFSDGTHMRFGRDDDACEITIWEQILSSTLSRVAGELWCANGRMWVQNLSTVHEIVVEGKDGKSTLRARLPDEPGEARSVPVPRGTILAPTTGSWRIVVEQVAPLNHVNPAQPAPGELTERFSDVPEPMWATANALCEPWLQGSSGPASHTRVAQVLGVSPRQGRRRVDELCEFYRYQIAALPGGQRAGETLTEAVARQLYQRRRVPAPPPPSSTTPTGSPLDSGGAG